MYNEFMVNRLKFEDALSLSWRNIVRHKGRSVIIILTIAILFGVLMGVNFVLRGLEVSLLDAATTKTEGKAYVDVRMGVRGSSTADIMRNQLDDIALGDLEKHGGKALGLLKVYDFTPNSTFVTDFQHIQVVDYSAVKDFVTVDLAEVPEGKVPVLAPEGGFKIEPYNPEIENPQVDWLREEIVDRYYIVGYLPVVNPTEQDLDKAEFGVGNDYTPTVPGGFNLLNLVLGNVLGGVSEKMEPIIVDDGSGKVAEYLAEKTEIWQEAQREQLEEWRIYDEPRVIEGTIAVFNNPVDLMGYVPVFSDSPISVRGFVDNSAEIVSAFDMAWLVVMVLEVIVLIVAVVIATFTFAHVVDQDANTLALYRSMGATTNNMYLIYFLYLLELCLLALVVSFLLGVVIVGVMAWMNVDALVVKWQSFWALSELSKVSLFGIDWHFWMVVIAMLLIAPVSLIFAQGRFSSRHIAKQLKED